MAEPKYKQYILDFRLSDGTTHSIPLKVPYGEKGDPFKYEDFTPEQLEALRGPEGKAPDAVLYAVQNLTPEQKTQARENIGAVTLDEVLAALPVGEGVRY